MKPCTLLCPHVGWDEGLVAKFEAAHWLGVEESNGIVSGELGPDGWAQRTLPGGTCLEDWAQRIA